MITARFDFGVATIENYIYVVGGKRLIKGVEKSCERYEVGRDEWSKIADFDEFSIGIAVVVTQKRYLMAFGGTQDYSFV